MKLHSIHLKNFKRHEDLQVDFAGALTAIRGPNWAGKSTILHAIFFAFFGVTAVPGGKAKIQRRGGGKTEVTLYLTNGTLIYRTLTTATVQHDEKIVASGHTAVNLWVEENVFGMDQRRAMLLCYAPQSETAALLTLGAPALNRMIEELTGADHVERNIEKAQAVAKTARDQLLSLGTLEPIDELRTSVANATESREQAVKDLEFANSNLGMAKLTFEACRDNLSKANTHNQKLSERSKVATQLEEIRTQWESLDLSLEHLVIGDVDQLQQALNDAVESSTIVVEAHADMKRLVAAGAELKAWLEKNPLDPDKVAKDKKALTTATTAKTKAEEKVRELLQKVSDVATKIAEKQAAVNGAACRECKRAFDQKLLDVATKELLSLQSDKAELDEKVSVAKKALATATATFNAAVQAVPSDATIALVEDKISRVEKIAEELEVLNAWKAESIPDMSMEEAITSFKNGVTEANQKLSDTKAAIASRDRTLRSQRDLEARASALEATLATLPEGELRPIEDLQRDEAKALVRVQEQQQLVANANAAHATADTALTIAQAALQRAEAVEAKRLALESKASRYGELAKWLQASKARFLSEIWDGILAAGSQFIAGATQGYASAMGRTDDGDFSVVEDGEDGPMVGASGGMKAICATGLRIGLDSLLPQGLGFLLLDEPSSELNEDNAAGMAGALRAQDKQVILVTHREGEEFASDSVIELA